MRITVNGKQHFVEGTRTLDYRAVAFIASGRTDGPLLSVTYKNAAGKKTEGCLAPGDPVVEIQDGTIFNAYSTGNA